MRNDLLDQIRTLESELSSLWRRLAAGDGALPEQPLQALELCVGGQWYLVPLETVREVLQMVLPVPVPGAPAWLPGSFEYNESMVPIIDLGCRLGGQRSELSPELLLIVVDSPVPLGLLVESIGDVVSFDARTLAPPPAGIPASPFLAGTLFHDRDKAAHLLSVVDLARQPGSEEGA